MGFNKAFRGYLTWGLIIAAVGALVWLVPEPEGPPERKAVTTGALKKEDGAARGRIAAVIFKPDAAGTGLVKTEVEIGAGEDIAERITAAAAKLVSDPGGPFPADTVIREVFAYDGTAVISLDGEFRKNFHAGAWMELLTVYSLVNTVTESLAEIDRVKILIDDKEAEAFAGHVDISGEIAADMSLAVGVKEEGGNT